MTTGYVYVSDVDPGPMAGAAPGGTVIQSAADPSWIVVDRHLTGVPVRDWPGRLLRVRVVAPTAEEGRARTVGAELPYNSFYRVRGVEVLEELPAAALFGEHGGRVAEVLGVAMRLIHEEAEGLAAARYQGARDLSRAVFRRWDRSRLTPRPYPGLDLRDSSSHARMSVSPVGWAFGILHSVVGRSAEARGRPGIRLGVDEDGEEGPIFAGPWEDAWSALYEAAMALGAPELVDDAEREILLAGWNALESVTGGP